MTEKQVSREAQERDEEARDTYLLDISEIPPESIVFGDETGHNRHTSRRDWAWAPIGERARRRELFARGQK